jgi:hypothetical protein
VTSLLPADLHPDCVPLAWLLGRWEGNGHGDYPTIERFSFGQEIVFSQDGRPFVHYFSRTWLVDDEQRPLRPAALETGFFRPRPHGELEVVLAHHSGFAEIWYGKVAGAQIELGTDVVARTSSAKDYTAGHRLFGLVEGDLMWAFDMAAVGQPLQSHTWGRLRRAATETPPAA